MRRIHDVPRIELDAAEIQSRFDELQGKLATLWPTISRFNDEAQTIVVVPSVSIEIDITGSEMHAYEERFLFLLLLLRQPRARMVYVTSTPIPQDVIDYYVDLLPGVIPSHARERLHALAVGDPEPIPLTHKILRRPRFIDRMRSLIIDPDRAHMVPFNTTDAERDLALRLGIPMYGADPRFEPVGTKSGSREVFRRSGVPHPYGRENVRTVDDVIEAVADVRRARPEAPAVLVKLNRGVSGEGNAEVDVRELDPGDRSAVEQRILAMTLAHPPMGADGFLERLQADGGVVEERVVGDEIRSPSVQLRVIPDGTVEILSTHDQLLGGETGQSYLGCAFPADRSYAATIAEMGHRVGSDLAEQGVLGRFAVDFLAAAAPSGAWDIHAIELNLRKGGTTHPFLTLQFLTDGSYDWQSGRFTTPRGEQKCLVANDHVESPNFRVLEVRDLFDIVVRNRLHFDHARQTGIVLHMLASLGECGRFGMTAVSNDRPGAEELYRQAVQIFEMEAAAAATQRALPEPT